MTQKIFRRVEKKYLISEKDYQKILKLTNKYLKKDKYYCSTICNVYFDNNNDDLIINSIEKPLYKEKVRLRSYGVPTLNSKVFFEIKKKYNGTVYKRRETLKLKDVYTYLKTGKYKETQIMKEIDYCFKNYQLKPAIYLAYDRFAYRAIDDENFRVTFDYNIRSRKTKIQLDQGDKGKRLLRKNQYIMEVKCLEAMPLWFCEILSNLKIYPTSFSKYGKIYEKNFMGG